MAKIEVAATSINTHESIGQVASGSSPPQGSPWALAVTMLSMVNKSAPARAFSFISLGLKNQCYEFIVNWHNIAASFYESHHNMVAYFFVVHRYYDAENIILAIFPPFKNGCKVL